MCGVVFDVLLLQRLAGFAVGGIERMKSTRVLRVVSLVLTAFFGVATVASVKGVFGHYTKEESVRYVILRKTNRLGHWVVMLYSTATLALALGVMRVGENDFLTRCRRRRTN